MMNMYCQVRVRDPERSDNSCSILATQRHYVDDDNGFRWYISTCDNPACIHKAKILIRCHIEEDRLVSKLTGGNR